MTQTTVGALGPFPLPAQRSTSVSGAPARAAPTAIGRGDGREPPGPAEEAPQEVCHPPPGPPRAAVGRRHQPLEGGPRVEGRQRRLVPLILALPQERRGPGAPSKDTPQ